jgi:hypothetical protein
VDGVYEEEMIHQRDVVRLGEENGCPPALAEKLELLSLALDEPSDALWEGVV